MKSSGPEFVCVCVCVAEYPLHGFLLLEHVSQWLVDAHFCKRGDLKRVGPTEVGKFGRGSC